MNKFKGSILFEQVKLALSSKVPVREEADLLFEKYALLFNEDYLDRFNSDEIAQDIISIATMGEDKKFIVDLYKRQTIKSSIWRIKLMCFGARLSLSYILPLIENFGICLIDEHISKIYLSDVELVYICHFTIQINESYKHNFTDATILNFNKLLLDVLNKSANNDSMNQLVISSQLNSQEINFLRAISHYIAQMDLPFSAFQIKKAFSLHPRLACSTFKLLSLKFNVNNTYDPDLYQQEKERFNELLLQVEDINEDRILRAYLSVIDAMVRTNFYLPTRSSISFKINSMQLPFIPTPKPLYEIFVYADRVEGIHLRGGKVARGGIRWSDRTTDFRTEVVGLLKAQLVKNTIIIPTGAKGGFICKHNSSSSSRDEYIAEGIACYKIFISGLLDITDNIVDKKIVHPQHIVCHDDYDPYLVLAADKGTATFSDYANSLSQSYHFWLNDAFASGGSHGYDHKKIGITARGAWESATRHLQFLGININKQTFSVVGIGDMSGDVFGNGMLLSHCIKLVAAFNHEHIFIDPNPDCELSYQERKRLFELPNSSWSDYNVKVLSKGGGIYLRKTKLIKLNNEIKSLLGIQANTITSAELIQRILTLKVDMIYNGGIGTYIKSSIESNASVKDKTNDQVRASAISLGAKVIVEGGNLGVTQAGRVEFAKNKGLIFTDAIDNSAGVDCSDHEVNLKILFSSMIHHNTLTLNERNSILDSLTNDIANLVLRDNYLQTRMIYCCWQQASALLLVYVDIVKQLVRDGYIKHKSSLVLSEAEILDRKRLQIGYTLPELSLLSGYVKQYMKEKLVLDSITDELMPLLVQYFPNKISSLYMSEIEHHYLYKEIINNQIVNLIINVMGITFVSKFKHEFIKNALFVIKAFWVVYNVLHIDDIISIIESLDHVVSMDLQINIMLHIQDIIVSLIRWMLQKQKYFDSFESMTELVSIYTNILDDIFISVKTVLSKEEYVDLYKLDKQYLHSNIPEELVAFLSHKNYFISFFNIAFITHSKKQAVDDIVRNYFYLGVKLNFYWLREKIIDLPEHNKWQVQAKFMLLNRLQNMFNQLISLALSFSSSADFVYDWANSNPDTVTTINAFFAELTVLKVIDVTVLFVALDTLYSYVND